MYKYPPYIHIHKTISIREQLNVASTSFIPTANLICYAIDFVGIHTYISTAKAIYNI